MGERRQLWPMIDDTRFDPACDPNVFFWIKPNAYWTATIPAWDRKASSFAWSFYLLNGYADYYNRGYECFVLAVRPAGVPGQ
jgi:hypothetical protein